MPIGTFNLALEQYAQNRKDKTLLVGNDDEYKAIFCKFFEIGTTIEILTYSLNSPIFNSLAVRKASMQFLRNAGSKLVVAVKVSESIKSSLNSPFSRDIEQMKHRQGNFSLHDASIVTSGFPPFSILDKSGFVRYLPENKVKEARIFANFNKPDATATLSKIFKGITNAENTKCLIKLED